MSPKRGNSLHISCFVRRFDFRPARPDIYVEPRPAYYTEHVFAELIIEVKAGSHFSIDIGIF